MAVTRKLGWLKIFIWITFLTSYSTAICYGQSTPPLVLRQTAGAATQDDSCRFDNYTTGTLLRCSGRPTQMTLSFNPTAPGSALLIEALAPVNGCVDNRGQVWNGSVFEFSLYTSGFLLFTPPATAKTDGLTSVTCDVSTSFLNVAQFSWAATGSNGYQGEQILQFFEVGTTARDMTVQADQLSITFGLGQAYMCQAVPPQNGLAIAGSKANQDLSDTTGLIGSGLPAISNVVSEVWNNYFYDSNNRLTSSYSVTSIYADKSAYATFNASGAKAAIQCSDHNCGCLQATFKPVPIPVAPDLGPCEDCNASVGNPINITNGNTYIEAQDYSLPGLGGGISLHRTWNSLWPVISPITQAGLFGDSWRSTYEEQLQFIDLAHLKYWRGDGSTWSFLYVNGTWTLQSPANQYVNLTFDSNAALYTLTYRDGAQKVFTQSGYLIAMRDRNGNTTGLTYDTSNRLVQVTDAGGRSLMFTYGDAHNPKQVTAISDAVGIVATYTYDNASHLLQARYADGTVNSYIGDSSGLIATVLDNEGKVLEAHTYDAQRHGLSSQRATGVDLVTVNYGTNGAVQITDSAGRSSSYSSLKIADWGKITSVSGTTCASCGAQGPGTYAYDAHANRTSSTDALGRKTTFTYDAFGDVLTRSIQAGGNTLTWSYTYNNFGDVLTATDPMTFTTTMAYDNRGNLLSTTTPAPDSNHPGSTTSFIYDPKGELVRVTDPRGNSTTMTYTSAGLIASITDAQGKVTQFQYDRRGNRTSVTDALGNVTTYAYDARDRLTKVTKPDQTTQQYTYDSRGRRASAIDPNGKVTTYAYDDADHLIAVTDAAHHVTQYAYDSENNLTSITDALGRQTTFLYDSQRRVTQTTFPSGRVEAYTYDAVGNLLGKTDRNRNTITFGYDELNRLTRKQYPDATGVDYTYDADSRTTQVTDATGTYQFTYDNMGRMTGAMVGYSFLPGKTFSIGYSYDAGSNRTSMTDPQGGPTRYVYDSLNRLVNITDPGTDSFTFAYDALGRRAQLGRSNGNLTTYQYDSLSRLLAVLHVKDKNTIDGAQYTYDAAGNRTSKRDLLKPERETTTYSYDDVYELVQAALKGKPADTYSYDAAGNRMTSIGNAFNYNQSNELVGFTNSSGGHTYLYDSNGNPTAKIEPVGTTTYTWDFENRIVQVAGPKEKEEEKKKERETTSLTFRYDPFGRRIQKVSREGTINYLYDGANLLEELDATGAVKARYTQGAGIDEPLAARRGRETRFYQADGLGSITSLTRESGALADFYVYDSYGKVTERHGDFDQPFRFTGRELDEETGLMYYRARYYDPVLGRFLSEDPGTWLGGTNFYQYSGNAPTNFVDPSGYWPTQTSRSLGVQVTPHQAAIDRVLGYLPEADRAVLRDQQLRADLDQSALGSFKHAMRDVTRRQTPEEARKAANCYIGVQVTAARNFKAAGNRELMLRAMGNVIHLLQDATSPAHAGFQPWDGNIYSEPSYRHVQRENFDPGSGGALDAATIAAWSLLDAAALPADFFMGLGVDQQ